MFRRLLLLLHCRTPHAPGATVGHAHVDNGAMASRRQTDWSQAARTLPEDQLSIQMLLDMIADPTPCFKIDSGACRILGLMQ